eukprot:5073833-Pyramimonas_sp.AAC.1
MVMVMAMVTVMMMMKMLMMMAEQTLRMPRAKRGFGGEPPGGILLPCSRQNGGDVSSGLPVWGPNILCFRSRV